MFILTPHISSLSGSISLKGRHTQTCLECGSYGRQWGEKRGPHVRHKNQSHPRHCFTSCLCIDYSLCINPRESQVHTQHTQQVVLFGHTLAHGKTQAGSSCSFFCHEYFRNSYVVSTLAQYYSINSVDSFNIFYHTTIT